MTFVDGDYYIKTKLAQLTAAGAVDANGQPYNSFTLLQAFAKAGLTPEEHYNTYGRYEGINPNAYFNEKEYLHAKLAALQTDPNTAAFWADRSINDLQAVIQAAGMTPAEHYEQYGSKETTVDGHLLNPSNAFDANAYVAAKLAQLQSADNPSAEERALWADKTVADLVKVLQDENISPVTHYQNYGASEATTAKVPLVQTVPVAQRMPNDPARETITGEIVPGNYNPATPPPGEAKPAPVTKPADMGGKADAAVSPPVHVPAKPLPVPGDANYTPPPDGLVDSNDKPVLPPASSGGNWVVVNPDGGGTIIKPDGTPGGTYPPGSMDPANPVIPDSKPDTGGDSKPGGDDPVTPPQEAGKHVDLTDVSGKQNLTLGTGDDTVVGVKPEHLPPDSAPAAFDRGHINGKAGNDSITFTPGAYDLQIGQLRSFEHVTVKNTTQDFTWRIGASDFDMLENYTNPKAEITATDLTTGKIRVENSDSWLDLSLTTGDAGDNILVAPGGFGKIKITSGKGDDRLVLVGSGHIEPDEGPVSDAVFEDITSTVKNAGSGYFDGTLDLGAGTNTLKVYGYVNLTEATLLASDGTVSMELLGVRGGADMTFEQYKLLTANAQIAVNCTDNFWLSVSGNKAQTIDLGALSISDNASVSFILENGIQLTGKPTVSDTANKGRWDYWIMDPGTYTGISGHDEFFRLNELRLKGGVYTANQEDNDIISLSVSEHSEQSPLILNDGNNGGTLNGFSQLIVFPVSSSDPVGAPIYSPTNIAFGEKTDIEIVHCYNTDDAPIDDRLDITNLTTKHVILYSGNDVLKGVKAAHFAIPLSSHDGGEGNDVVTFAESAAYTISPTQLMNFETVNLGTATDVAWTLGQDDYKWRDASGAIHYGPDNDTRMVTVNASAITGKLTFDASAVSGGDTPFGFAVTGGAGNDIITGGAGADMLNGGSGSDTYVYTTLAHSLVSAFDTVTFEAGDKIGVSSDQLTGIQTVGGFVTATGTSTADSLATDIGAIIGINADPMIAYGAALVTITTGSNAGTYLALNDGDIAFRADTDAVIKIVGTIPGAGDFVLHFA